MRFSVRFEFKELGEVTAFASKPTMVATRHVSCSPPFNEMHAQIAEALEHLEDVLKTLAAKAVQP